MNNTSRFKFYGILTALILVAVGMVWFYPRTEHSSKVPRVKRDEAAKQVNRPPKQRPQQQPVTSSTQQPEMDDIQKFIAQGLGPEGYKVLSHAMGTDIPPDKKPRMDVTPELWKQLEVPLKAIKSDVMEMLAGNASYQQTNNNTIVINTRLSQEQSDKIEKRLYKEAGDIIGAENVEKLDSVLYNPLRLATYAWGTGEMQFTVIGVNGYNIGNVKQTEQPLKTAEAFVLKTRYNLPGGVFFGEGYDFSSKSSLIKEIGSMATAALKMASEEGN